MSELGHEIIDCGAFSYEPTDDYPDYITPCVKKVVTDVGSFGIILGGSGQGEAMDANRIVGARACEYYGGTLDVLRVSREHNDANVLSLGARFITEDEAKQAVKVFLETPFSNDPRHVRRIEKF